MRQSGITKAQTLRLLTEIAEVRVDEAAEHLAVGRAAASMALLRLVRQGLAWRRVEPEDGLLRYALTERGYARLEYLTQVHGRVDLNRLYGGSDMRRLKTHTGNFVCTECFVEYELVGESSLKCPDCGGPLTSGTLDDLESDDDE